MCIRDRHNRWPKTPTGKFKEDDKTFSRFSKFIPEIDEIKSAFFITNAMKLKGYAVGKDKRSRTALNMMGQKLAEQMCQLLSIHLARQDMLEQ